jgi:hypothetical protein
MSIEPERAVPTEPPPSYTQEPNFPPQQPYFPLQSQPAGAGYAPGYQQFVNPQTSTSTTVVLPPQVSG